jgi:hypothetical protein
VRHDRTIEHGEQPARSGGRRRIRRWADRQLPAEVPDARPVGPSATPSGQSVTDGTGAPGRPVRQHDTVSEETTALERAIALACDAHRGQQYPSPEAEPYILHPLRVMLAVSGLRAQTVAVLHDVLEDTSVTVEEIRAIRVSADVVDAVVALTHSSDQTYEDYIEQVADNVLARAVKLADLADNLANNRGLDRTPDVIDRIERYERAVRRLDPPARSIS